MSNFLVSYLTSWSHLLTAFSFFCGTTLLLCRQLWNIMHKWCYMPSLCQKGMQHTKIAFLKATERCSHNFLFNCDVFYMFSSSFLFTSIYIYIIIICICLFQIHEKYWMWPSVLSSHRSDTGNANYIYYLIY